MKILRLGFQRKSYVKWKKFPISFLPFSDAASNQLPLVRLLQLSLFQVSVGIGVVLLVGTLNRIMIVELGVSAAIAEKGPRRRVRRDSNPARLRRQLCDFIGLLVFIVKSEILSFIFRCFCTNRQIFLNCVSKIEVHF